MKNHVTTRQAAKILGVSKDTVRSMAQQKRIPFTKSGNRYYFKREDLLKEESAIEVLSREIRELKEMVAKLLDEPG